MFDDETKEEPVGEEEWTPGFPLKRPDEDAEILGPVDVEEDAGGRWGDDDMEAEGEE
ncbi:MAG: hypothetical protein V4674_04540 [Patescibacteria group bacterium]